MNGDDNVLFCYRFCEINSGLWDNAGEYFISTHPSTNLFFSFYLKPPNHPTLLYRSHNCSHIFWKINTPFYKQFSICLSSSFPKWKYFYFTAEKYPFFGIENVSSTPSLLLTPFCWVLFCLFFGWMCFAWIFL